MRARRLHGGQQGRRHLHRGRRRNGLDGSTCNCALDGPAPAKWPQTTGGDDLPLCSEIDVGAGGSPACGASGDACGLGTEPPCCSGICLLTVCE